MTHQEFFANHWHKEMKRTLVAIKGLPTDMSKLEYKPNEKSRTAHQIIGHILPHAEDMFLAITSGDINEQQLTFNNTEEAATYFEKNSQLLIEKVKTVSDEDWANKMISLTVGNRKIYEGKMTDMYWTLLLDLVHHRGQLSTYYRAMDMRNPSIYGPSAEDMEDMMKAAAKN
ncbi:MAG: hypothetical protein RL708_2147 [Bacteroidota bacterium]|jgi:uncharacterized damage-inducible protein DinB